MAEYLEKRETIQRLKAYCLNCGNCGEAIACIELGRPADVAPIVHGQWLGTADGYADGEFVYDMWECSNCGYDADGAEEKPIWKFCPKCGARMDLEVEDG